MKNRILWGLANIVLIAAIAYGIYMLLHRAPTEFVPNPVTIRSIKGLQPIVPPLDIPDQELFVDAEGKSVNLSRYKGKVVVFNMWATWCAPCVKEIPSLSRLKELRPDIEVVALSHDTAKTAAELRAFLDKYTAQNLEVFYSPHMKLQLELPTRGIPTTFLISPSGKIFNKVEGDIDWSSKETLALIDQTGAVQ